LKGEALPFVAKVLVSYWPNALLGAFLIGLALDFFFRFFCRAVMLRFSLKRVAKSLRHPEIAHVQTSVDLLPAVVGRAKSGAAFSGLWANYSKTLHAQRGTDETGQQRISRWRATALAETFFTQQALVDSPLRTEYFKHLPGILTGLGIIGTFAGLIRGLNHFDVSLEPEKVQLALGNLIRAVGHAFYVSAAAICLAIFFTFLEKLLLNMCYRQVEAIQQAIDGIFHAGVGEEYLERLVKASETSATQALQIKDALVADLKQILTEMTAQQVSASARDSSRISTEVGKVIAESLGGPMKGISVAVERAGAIQADAINTMLLDVLARFSEQMQEMFGGQMKGMSHLLMQTTQGMQETTSRFERLACSVDSAGKNVADAMAVVGQLHDQARTSAERHHEETARFADQTGATVMGLTKEVENLLRQSGETSRSLQGSVAAIGDVTRDAIVRMNSGAELLYVASREFAKAGEGVIASINGSSGAIDRIQAATHSLSSAMNGTVEVVAEYKRNREAFAMIVTDLKTTIQNAKKEAFMTSDLVEKLQGAASQLGLAQRQSEDYLRGINEVLTKAHEAFAVNIEKTLNRGNSQFHVELSTAVGLLSAGVQDLGDMFERVAANR
jgi:hypothetical protein